MPEERGDAILEGRDRRVLALLLVPDDGSRDSRAHAVGRLRHGVGAQVDQPIDHRADATVRPWISPCSSAR